MTAHSFSVDLTSLAPDKGSEWYRIIRPHCQQYQVDTQVDPDTGEVWTVRTPTMTYVYSTYLSKEDGDEIWYQHGEDPEHRRQFIKAGPEILGPQLNQWYGEIHHIAPSYPSDSSKLKQLPLGTEQ